MEKTLPGIPNILWPAVDVRDAADAHVSSLMSEVNNGERILITNTMISMMEIANHLHDNFHS